MPKIIFYILLGILLSGSFASAKNESGSAPEVVPVQGDVKYTHDPSIMKEKGNWYLFGTANGPVRNVSFPSAARKICTTGSFAGTCSTRFPTGSKKRVPRRGNCGPPIFLFSTANITFTTRSRFSARTPRELPCLQTKPCIPRPLIFIGWTADWCWNQSWKMTLTPLIQI